MVRSTFDKLAIDVIPNYRQPAYNNYVNYLPSYMKASFTRTAISIQEVFHPLMYKISPLFPIIYPALSVTFPGALPNNIKEDLIQHGFEEAMVKREKVMIFRNVTAEIVGLLSRSGASQTATCPGNTINLACIPALILIRKVFSAFFAVHTYPAFRDEDQLNNVTSLESATRVGKRKLVTAQLDLEDAPPAKRGPGVGDVDINMEGTSSAPASSDTISVALPQNLEKGWLEDDDTVPTAGGLFFHYIPDLSVPDQILVPRVLTNYFLGCFGSNKNETLQQIETVRARWGIISETDTGREITHMAACIDIGLRAQARIVPVFSNGVYNGCIISGVGYTVSINRRLYEPLSPSQLEDELARFGGRGSILRAIAELAVGHKFIETKGAKILVAESMWDLRELLGKCDLSETDRDEIVKLAHKLHFGRHWPINQTTICDALRLVASTDELGAIPLHPSVLFTTDRLSLVWSGFGPLAPTCHYLGGPVVTLPRDASGPIAWKNVKLNLAISDLQNLIDGKKFCKSQGGRRSGPFKDRYFEGKEAKPVWDALCSVCGAVAAGGGTDKGKGNAASSSSAGVLGAVDLVDDF